MKALTCVSKKIEASCFYKFFLLKKSGFLPVVFFLLCIITMSNVASAQNGTNTYYLDHDGDGFGTDFSITSSSPTPPPGYAWRPGDCNDSDASINPYAPEIPNNGIDENCNGEIDEPTCFAYYDNDRDGYGDPATQISTACDVDLRGTGFVRQGGDCDDNNASVHPGAIEICGNGIDDDCDGVIDNCAEQTYYLDNDGDGYGQTDSFITSRDPVPPAGYAALSGDCDDNNPLVNPGAIEIRDNGIDDNCDGVIDNYVYTYYIDNDGDGYGDASNQFTSYDSIVPPGYITQGGDCNDNDPSIHPGATEICGNGIDDNCDGQIDEGCPAYTYYFDNDQDGYGGDYLITITDTVPPPGYTTIGGDCNDYNSSIHPGATEICNGVDDNCDGVIDEGCTKGQLPDFTKNDIYGVSHHLYGDLSDGKAVVMEFSTGWCPFTQIAEPQISNVYDDICQGQGNTKLYDIVFETNVQGQESDSAFGVQYANLHNALYPVIANSKDVYDQFWYQYSITGIPTFFVVIPDANDPAQSSVYMITGAIDNLKDSIENLLTSHGFPVTPPPTLSITVTGSACQLPSPVTLTSNIFPGIVWSTGETTQSINVTEAGDYYLNYAAGCGTITQKVHLEKPVAGTLSSPTATACAGKGVITLEYDGGTTNGTLQYSNDGINWADFWSNFQTGTFLNQYPAGTTVYFRVHEIITSNSDLPPCDVYSNIVQILSEATSNPGLGITVSRTDCSFPVTLTSSFPDNNFWSTGETSQSITVNSPNTYSVINSDVCGDVADVIIVNSSTSTWYRDADGDGYGNPNISVQACIQPNGYVQDNSDCNDSDIYTHPGAPEICDGVDNNCDGQIDEGFSGTIFYRDADGDGFGDPNNSIHACTQPKGYVSDSSDCNDAFASINPNTVWYHDKDGDGYGDPNDSIQNCTQPSGYVTNNKDCNDYDGSIYPKIYYRDADGDGYGDPNNSVQSCLQPSGYVANNTDCNDHNASIHPKTFYHDADGDGYGSASDSIVACTKPAGYVTNNRDCNDHNATVYPGAPELCDGIDNNCNGKIDENCTFISIADVSVTEKPKAQRLMNFPLTLSKKLTQTATVNYTTQDGTATAGSDYVAQSGTVTFAPGIRRMNIAIIIDGDKIPEPDETFNVILSGAVNATLADSIATGTIINYNAPLAMDEKGSVYDNDNGFTIVPNPASSNVHISLTNYTGNVTIRLSDLQGKMLQEKKLESSMTKFNQTTLDVSRYADGVYFIIVFDDKGNYKTERLVIQR